MTRSAEPTRPGLDDLEWRRPGTAPPTPGLCEVRDAVPAGPAPDLLELEDIDWRAGELLVHGKGARTDRLPLPADVGDAIAGYLSAGQARIRCRAVVLRTCGPETGMSARSVVMVPRLALHRAGLSTVVGAHRLRHTAATGLRAGASLEHVADLIVPVDRR